MRPPALRPAFAVLAATAAVVTVLSGTTGAFSVEWPGVAAAADAVFRQLGEPRSSRTGGGNRRSCRRGHLAAAGRRVPVRLLRHQLANHEHQRSSQPGPLPERVERVGDRHDLLVVERSRRSSMPTSCSGMARSRSSRAPAAVPAASTSKTSRRMNSGMRSASATRRSPERRCIRRSRPATPGTARSTPTTSPASVRSTRRSIPPPPTGLRIVRH